MDIVLVEDAGPHRDPYRAAVGRGLAAAWRAAGHRLIPVGALGTPGAPADDLERLLDAHPGARVHLVTAGPAAEAVAAACARRQRPFTSTSARASVSLHERPRFAAEVERIHARAERVVTPVPAARAALAEAGVDSGVVVTAGVDPDTFQPRVYGFLDLPRPVTLLLGTDPGAARLRSFLETPLPGTRVVYAPAWTGGPVDGGVRFLSYLPPDELAQLISAADVCVVPGDGPEAILLALQSLACGVPVAAGASQYLEDLLATEAVGVADDNLGRGVTRALGGNRQICRSVARTHSWQSAAQRVLAAVRPSPHDAMRAA